MGKTTAVAKVEQVQAGQLQRAPDAILQSHEGMWRFAKAVSGTDFCPKDLRGKPEACLIALQAGKEVGLSPMQALQSIAPINGRATIFGAAIPALILSSGLCEAWNMEYEGEEYNDDFAAVCYGKRVGLDGDGTTRRFSVADAKKAGLWGKSGPWTLYPKAMLGWKAIARVANFLFADVLKGCAVREDVIDAVIIDAPTRPPQADLSSFATDLAQPAPAPEPKTPDLVVEPDAKPEDEMVDEPLDAEAEAEPTAPAQDQPTRQEFDGAEARLAAFKILLPFATKSAEKGKSAKYVENRLRTSLESQSVYEVCGAVGFGSAANFERAMVAEMAKGEEAGK